MTKIKRRTSEYSEEEVNHFNVMHYVLTAYNGALGTRAELQLPGYTDDEMAAYSIYREILLSEEVDGE